MRSIVDACRLTVTVLLFDRFASGRDLWLITGSVGADEIDHGPRAVARDEVAAIAGIFRRGHHRARDVTMPNPARRSRIASFVSARTLFSVQPDASRFFSRPPRSSTLPNTAQSEKTGRQANANRASTHQRRQAAGKSLPGWSSRGPYSPGAIFGLSPTTVTSDSSQMMAEYSRREHPPGQERASCAT